MRLPVRSKPAIPPRITASPYALDSSAAVTERGSALNGCREVAFHAPSASALNRSPKPTRTAPRNSSIIRRTDIRRMKLL